MYVVEAAKSETQETDKSRNAFGRRLINELAWGGMGSGSLAALASGLMTSRGHILRI